MEDALEKIGLSRQEAKVYLNTLKLGVAKASEIARKSNINREASYYILKLLQEKGFISEVIKSGVKYYNAINPKRILELLEEKNRQKKEALNEIMPQLESLQKIAITRPKIEVFEGMDGFKTIVGKIVEKHNSIIYAYVPEKTLHFLPTFHLQFRRRRRENKIHLKMITNNSKYMREFKRKDKEELRETKFFDFMRFYDSAYFVLPKAIIVIKANEKEQIGIYIQEESTAKMQKKVFEQLWVQN